MKGGLEWNKCLYRSLSTEALEFIFAIRVYGPKWAAPPVSKAFKLSPSSCGRFDFALHFTPALFLDSLTF